jgi:hypothetical protein
VTGNTGLLTARCDPYGAESRIKLLGGIYPENHVGRIMWHCKDLASARYRMICTGGEYGTRRKTGDVGTFGTTVAGTVCPGGHQGQIMPLCEAHRREIARRQSEACPRCLYPPAGLVLSEAIEANQREWQVAMTLQDWAQVARLTARHESMSASMSEMMAAGVIHKCPLRLVEVS